MQIFIAVIEHKFGNDAYAASTNDKLYERIAKFCNSWADDVNKEDGDADEVRRLFADWNEVCLYCRKSANTLPCSHPKLIVKNVRVPRKSASNKQWRKFVDWLNWYLRGSSHMHFTNGQAYTLPLRLPKRP